MTGGGISDDARQLAALGHTQELKRTFSPLAMLGLAFAILNSWTALATSLSLALPSGGPTSVLWGSQQASATYVLQQVWQSSSVRTHRQVVSTTGLLCSVLTVA